MKFSKPGSAAEEVVYFCERLDQKGFVANHDGNISVRSNAGFTVTPSGYAKAEITKDDLLELDASGKKTSGKGNPFSEWSIHQKIFSARKEVQAVIHAHPVSATAVGCANQELVTWAIPEAVVSLGPGIPLVGLGLPGSAALMSELESLIPYHDAIMIAGNGVFTWGTALEQAYLRLELVEHVARICLQSLPLGGPKLLPIADVRALLEKRKQAGLALPADPARPHWY